MGAVVWFTHGLRPSLHFGRLRPRPPQHENRCCAERWPRQILICEAQDDLHLAIARKLKSIRIFSRTMLVPSGACANQLINKQQRH